MLKPFVESGVVAEVKGGSLSALLEHCLGRPNVDDMVHAASSAVNPGDTNGDCDAYRRTRLSQVSATLVRLLELRIGPGTALPLLASCQEVDGGGDASPVAAWDRVFW